MRGATQCARRLKQLFRSLRTKLGKVPRSPSGDAITQMILGVFSRDVPESKAREALDRLRAIVVDYNELRVVAPIEMSKMIGELPNARMKCEDLSRALNKIFAREHEVSLDRLDGLRKKEVSEFLEAIDGLDAYSRARVRLSGLHQHAVPLDEAMWAYARRMGIVDKRCSLREAQAFLERRIPEGDALEFVALLEKQAWAEMGAAVRTREVEPITSVPPDRTARNMLQLIASGRSAASATRPEEDEASGARAKARSGKTASRGRADRPPARVSKKVRKPRKSKLRKSKPKKSRRKAVPRPKAAKRTAKRKAKKVTKRGVKARAKIRAKARTKRRGKPTVRAASKAKTTVRAKAVKRTRRLAPKARSA